MKPPSTERTDFDKTASRDHLQKLDALRKAAFQRIRRPPSPEEMARRKSRLAMAKWLLPAIASVLLISIAAWPEINHLIHQNGAILREMRRIHAESGRMENAVYRDIDSQGRPYTLTSRSAHQIDDDKVELTDPVADIQLAHQSWVHVRADHGTYLQHEQTLNLNGHFTLYRNDGLLLNSPTADLDIKQQVIATHDWVHAEGPFGTQDAQGAFLDQNTNTVQFMGPGLTNRFDDLNHPPSVSVQNKP
ncbi:LPS export ABC transporter periplasmic protein LptC [Saccharibacter sp. 17.LH.SD]|uniref:LPS export ABC transporter periplasmic protein LptC n=1 Tax=Saccharibacter sp. 17.LH.SD TaxID=2689393 RepID=UPI00136F9334|nr:LPS export ABC transporter periplasmic protein LptC [Saccharibacter sp. 17.LH.SD]MXV44118.1 LPS export ABC transporter periplasmic protein LptC [Saccharibacter sp. 17.LH.SD]